MSHIHGNFLCLSQIQITTTIFFTRKICKFDSVSIKNSSVDAITICCVNCTVMYRLEFLLLLETPRLLDASFEIFVYLW